MRGPNTEPWGTPKGRITASEKLSPILIWIMAITKVTDIFYGNGKAL